MQFGTVLLPEGVSESKLLRYPLLTPPSKALARGHFVQETGKKSILSTMEGTLSSPL